MRDLAVRTRQSFPCSAGAVWSLLCNSRMDGTSKLLFKLGVPQPVQCRVTDDHGGVGSERECISDQGVVHQRILEWLPDRRLSFRMERTDMQFRRFVREIVDTFDLVPSSSGVLVTRVTKVSTTGRFQIFRRITLYLGLKQVHRYVFQNWQRLAKQGVPPLTPRENSSPLAPSS
jgi:hypothetical protein